MGSIEPVNQIFTDGACKGNPGPGGWASLMIGANGERISLSGNTNGADTTNNVMELTAAIRILEAVPERTEVVVYSDSEYLVKTMTRHWKRNKNLELWRQLDALSKILDIRWEWIKGHAGNLGNEFVNDLAGYEAGVRKTPPQLDHYFPSYKNTEVGQEKLTHLDERGHAHMVDVGWKKETEREAVAKGTVFLKAETLSLMVSGGLEKGDALGAARLAGVMGAKLTPQLIPLSHPIPLDQVLVDLDPDETSNTVNITATAKSTGRTGVEMEALVAVMTAALTLYDMCKSLDRGMRIHDVRLVSKKGGKSGDLTLE
jgi:cyclic pyranopterin phosphate synthase